MSEEIIEHQTEHHDHQHSDTVNVPFIGNVTAPGGIYTIVFGVLGGLTVLEVLIAELTKGLTDGPVYTVRTIALFTISLLKAILVVWFYMHLRIDNPIFRYILLIPLLVVTVSVIYLLGVPLTAGLGYR